MVEGLLRFTVVQANILLLVCQVLCEAKGLNQKRPDHSLWCSKVWVVAVANLGIEEEDSGSQGQDQSER